MAKNRFHSVTEIITFAIGREIEAAEAYDRMAGSAATPGLRELLRSLRDEERAHRRLLEGLTPDQIGRFEPSLVPDLKIVDTLADETFAPDMTLQDLLILAARKEKEAVELYESLARAGEAAGLQQTFLFLAGQEKNHKLKLEAEYERRVLQEN